jgi:hypothetical protein
VNTPKRMKQDVAAVSVKSVNVAGLCTINPFTVVNITNANSAVKKHNRVSITLKVISDETSHSIRNW